MAMWETGLHAQMRGPGGERKSRIRIRPTPERMLNVRHHGHIGIIILTFVPVPYRLISIFVRRFESIHSFGRMCVEQRARCAGSIVTHGSRIRIQV